MARFRMIDMELPDDQVGTVVETFRAMFPAAVAISTPRAEPAIPLALPPAPGSMVAPAPVPEPDPPAIAPEPVPARVARQQRRKMRLPALPRSMTRDTAAAPGIADRVALALPGAVEDIMRRTGLAKGQVIGNLYYLRSRGRAVHEGETWRPVDGKPAQAAPVRTRKRRATQPAAAEPAASGPAEPRMTTADLFLEQLESGPATTRELLTGAQRAGKPVANEHMASNILRTLEKRGQVRQGDGERWERVK